MKKRVAFPAGCRDDPMPYIGLQSEWFVAMEDAVPALEAAIAASKEWPGWVQKRGFCGICIENDLFTKTGSGQT